MKGSEGPIRRRPGGGWVVLLGGGEFSFGDTFDADAAWVAKLGEGPVGFLPTASGSADYGRHFATYLEESFGRTVDTVPIYRARDARRGKNLERLRAAAGLYLGGGVPDELLEVLSGSPAAESLAEALDGGAVVAAIGAAAQALGVTARPLGGGVPLPGLDWLPEGVVEPAFSPAHDRRLRALVDGPGVSWGLGMPPGSAVLLGPGGEVELIGTVFLLEGADGDLVPLGAALDGGEDDPEAPG